MAKLNCHHLHYFWVIANENNLTRAAERLHISQSALSIPLVFSGFRSCAIGLTTHSP
jgi:hypothetical protein